LNSLGSRAAPASPGRPRAALEPYSTEYHHAGPGTGWARV